MSLIINENLIHLDFEVDSKEEAIRELSKIVLQQNRLNTYETCTAPFEERTAVCNETKNYCYDAFLKNVLDREELSTTGIGFGIAIPHGKCCAVAEPTVVFARLKKSIDWQSLDGEPVEAVFLLAVPKAAASNEHLRILAALSRKLMHDDFKDMLFTAQDKDALETLLKETLVA
ncbi:PTS fructose transporter subunit IIA [Bacillus sp. HMF5848]|uniref:PTS sugar transporter subunit IIA n=1 Tax=Bacillus sp. HMF5848 TaxID=2495421 RepID=UPI000F776CD0|nr:fructose PTS transporter subunit IIA [Bacillus sp. HMF5848]RSK25882.1 PTS fructose transporter subunit IIA [Bacillus sp. HMF5848]